MLLTVMTTPTPPQLLGRQWSLSSLFSVIPCYFFCVIMEALFDTSILSWNIRGAQNNTARRHLKDLIRRFTPTFFAILETHVPFARLSNFWSNNGYSPVHIIEASGHLGGI
jgi:hypothetical protein